jgi:hypothetical protein
MRQALKESYQQQMMMIVGTMIRSEKIESSSIVIPEKRKWKNAPKR